MRVVFLVPWRTDGGPREAAWGLCRQRWEALFPDWPVYEGSSPMGPFNRAAAINNAARQAGDWDVAIVIDADVMLRRTNVTAAVAAAAKTGKVTWAHRRWRGITEEATLRLCRPDPVWTEGALGRGGIAAPDFEGADLDLIIEKTTRMSWSCCIAVRRDAWETIGGFDERFAGWGFEDLAFQAASGGLVGWDRIEGDVLNLHHPRVPGAGKADRDANNRHTAQALVNGRLGMRYMVALRRDYGLTDRPEPAGEAELQRDIRNLIAQDEKFAAEQQPNDRDRFTDWWPTLEELRDGAKAYRERRANGVTVVVQSGGPAENWPIRSAYLRESLASLDEQLVGTVIQRIVYSGWPAEITPDLAAIAAEFGFYVSGEGHHGHTGVRQRMWPYLKRRALGNFIFATEDDFLYRQPIELDAMVRTLQDNGHLQQVALLRDACYQDERDTGGILGWPEPAFTRIGENGTSRLEHRLFWTNNPSVFRKELTSLPWPNSQEDPLTGRGKGSEVVFAEILKRDASARFAFWGSGDHAVEHIGEVRAGSGY